MTHFLDWKEEWSTGIPDIDATHKTITNKLNRLFNMSNNPLGESENNRQLERALSELQELTRQHFQSEEETMRSFNYPQFSNHKREHQILLAELSQLIRDIKNKGLALNQHLQNDLKHWFIAHTLICDKSFAKYYHALSEGDASSHSGD